LDLWIFRAVCLLNFAFVIGVVVADAPLRPGDQIEMKMGGIPSTEILALSGRYTLDDERASTFRTSAGKDRGIHSWSS
jgi:hypothetical protein